MRSIQSFLGHAGFYKRFIHDFLKILKPLCNLLQKDVKVVFYDKCLEAFETLKKALISTPILITPNWSEPFIVICDASDWAFGVVLGQIREKSFRVIHYASRTLDATQRNYTTTEREFLAIVFTFDKFRPYLVGNHTIVYSDHSVIRYLVGKKDAKPHLIRWILLFQDFDM